MRATITRYVIPILAVLLVGYGWLKAHDAQVRAEALAQARADSMRVALARIDSLAYQYHADSVAYVRERDSLLAITDEYGGRAASLRERNRELADRLDAALAEADDPFLTAAVDTLRREAAACDTALTACRTANVVTLGRLAVADSLVGELEPANVRLTELWQDAERRAHPGFVKTLIRTLPYLAVAFAGGLVIGQL
jgi:hypothetical protein